MKLLIIGGTQFLGRHLTTAALAGNHEVTLFNRGNHPSPAMANVETIVGDRNRDLHKLKGRHWDGVVDTCGFLPDNVRAVAEFCPTQSLAMSSSRVFRLMQTSAWLALTKKRL